jgi:hypothetical protein
MAKTKSNGQTNLAAMLAAMKHPQAALMAASAPAATAPLPAWIEAAVAAQPAKVAAQPATPKVPASLTRSWSAISTGISKAGNPYIVFGTKTLNGRPFNVTVPADLVAFIGVEAN